MYIQDSITLTQMSQYWLGKVHGYGSIGEDPDFAAMAEETSGSMKRLLNLTGSTTMKDSNNWLLFCAYRAASLWKTLHSKSHSDMGENSGGKFDADTCWAEWKAVMKGRTDLKGMIEMWDKTAETAMQLEQATQSAILSTIGGMNTQDSRSTVTALKRRARTPSVEPLSKHRRLDSNAPHSDTEMDWD